MFEFLTTRETVRKKKEKYDEQSFKDLKQFKEAIQRPLLDIQAIRNYCSASPFDSVDGYLPPLINPLNLEFEKNFSKRISDLEEEVDEQIKVLEEMTVDLKDFTLEDYSKYSETILAGVEKKAEKIIHEANKVISELFGDLAVVSFKNSDALLDITEQLKNAAQSDLLKRQKPNPEPPDQLLQLLPKLIESKELAEVYKEQLGVIYEKLNSPETIESVLFGLNKAFFVGLPPLLDEIAHSKLDIIERIEKLKNYFEKKESTPLKYYLDTCLNLFSLYKIVTDQNKQLKLNIEKKLEDWESIITQTPSIKEIMPEYRKRLDGLLQAFDMERSNSLDDLKRYQTLNKGLENLDIELQTGKLFKSLKEEKLRQLKKLKFSIEGLASRDEKTLSNIIKLLDENSMDGINKITSLLSKHQLQMLRLNERLQKYLSDCEKSTTIEQIIYFPEVEKLLLEFYEPLGTEIKEYYLAAEILLSNTVIPLTLGSSDVVVKKQLDSEVTIKVLMQNLKEKVFFLLGRFKIDSFYTGIDKLLRIIHEAPHLRGDIPLAKNDMELKSGLTSISVKMKFMKYLTSEHFQQFVAEPNQLERICDYIHQAIKKKNFIYYSSFNAYLGNMDSESLKALSKKRKDLRQTIGRILVTQQLLTLQRQYHNDDDNDNTSLWETCKQFKKFGETLPLFTSEQEKNWYFKVQTAAIELVNRLEQSNIGNNKTDKVLSFLFLKTDTEGEKLKALNSLKDQISTLPTRLDKNSLEVHLKNWEDEFGKTIDKPRYRFYLVLLMKIYHVLKLLSGKKESPTHSRFFVENIKSNICTVVDAMKTEMPEEPNAIGSPTNVDSKSLRIA